MDHAGHVHGKSGSNCVVVSRQKEAAELPGAAAQALLGLYQKQAPDKAGLVEGLLKRQGLLPK